CGAVEVRKVSVPAGEEPRLAGERAEPALDRERYPRGLGRLQELEIRLESGERHLLELAARADDLGEDPRADVASALPACVRALLVVPDRRIEVEGARRQVRGGGPADDGALDAVEPEQRDLDELARRRRS